MYEANRETLRKTIGSWYDVGLNLKEDGTITDVREGSAAWNAGLGDGMQIVAMNGREFTPDAWASAVAATSASFSPIALLVKQNGYFQNVTLNYRGGAKHPHLVRIPGTTDMFAQIMRPHAK